MTSENDDLSDDILVAFADGELPAEELARLRPIIEADPAASEIVDAYRQSGEALRDFFTVDVPAQTPQHIANQIREFKSDTSASNVVSFSAYRERISHELRNVTSSPGLQKIVASLFVGVFLGVGGASQFGVFYDPKNERKQEITYRSGGAATDISASDGVSFALNFDGKIIRPGEIIPSKKPFKIVANLKAQKTITIIYHEASEPPKILVKNKKLDNVDKFYFPYEIKKVLYINTNPIFVTFEVILSENGIYSRKFYGSRGW